MREDTMSLQDFAEVIRDDLQMNLSGPYPSVKVEIQQVEKIMGESYLGAPIRSCRNMESQRTSFSQMA